MKVRSNTVYEAGQYVEGKVLPQGACGCSGFVHVHRRDTAEKVRIAPGQFVVTREGEDAVVVSAEAFTSGYHEYVEVAAPAEPTDPTVVTEPDASSPSQ